MTLYEIREEFERMSRIYGGSQEKRELYSALAEFLRHFRNLEGDIHDIKRNTEDIKREIKC